MASDIRKHTTLVKQVFGNDKGKELLEALEALNGVAFTPNTNEQYMRIGKHVLIQELKYLVNASAKDIKEMESAESYDSSNDDF